MSLKKAAIWCLALVLTFSAGVGTGVYYFSSDVRTVFTPQEDGLDAYLKFLDTAKRTVHIACYSFTDPRITAKLVELQKRGVKVYVLLDKSQTLGRSAPYIQKAIDELKAAGAVVLVGTSEKHHEIMHNKFTVVDGIAVEDGSWNYTKSANSQNNTLNFHWNRTRARQFQENWQRMHDFMEKQSRGTTGTPRPKTNKGS